MSVSAITAPQPSLEENGEIVALNLEESRQLRALRTLGGQGTYPYAVPFTTGVDAALTGRIGARHYSAQGIPTTAATPVASGTSAIAAKTQSALAKGSTSAATTRQSVGGSAADQVLAREAHVRELQLHNQQLAANAVAVHQIQAELHYSAQAQGQVSNPTLISGTAVAAASNAADLPSVEASHPQIAQTNQQAADHDLASLEIERDLNNPAATVVNPFFFSAVSTVPIRIYTTFNAANHANGGTQISRVSAISKLQDPTIEARA